MRVLFAYYGLSCTNGQSTNQQRSTNWVAGLCNGKTTCSGVVSVSVLTDPYYGCHKDFLAIAECDYGRIVAAYVPSEADGRQFILKCYINSGPVVPYNGP